MLTINDVLYSFFIHECRQIQNVWLAHLSNSCLKLQLQQWCAMKGVIMLSSPTPLYLLTHLLGFYTLPDKIRHMCIEVIDSMTY